MARKNNAPSLARQRRNTKSKSLKPVTPQLARAQHSNSSLTPCSSASSSSTDWLSSIHDDHKNQDTKCSDGIHVEVSIPGGKSSDIRSSKSGMLTVSNGFISGETSLSPSPKSDVPEIVNGYDIPLSPASGMRPHSFYRQKLHSHSFSLTRSPPKKYDGTPNLKDKRDRKKHGSIKRKHKKDPSIDTTAHPSKKPKKQNKRTDDLSVKLCDVIKYGSSPRTSPTQVTHVNGLKNGYTAAQVSNSPEVNGLEQDNQLSGTPPRSVVDEIIFELGSLCSEDSLTSGLGSVKSDMFLKGKNGEYVFSNSTSSSLDQNSNEFVSSQLRSEKGMYKSSSCLESVSSETHSDELHFASLKREQSDRTDSSYSPCFDDVDSESLSHSSPEHQTSITRYFKTSTKHSSPDESKKNIVEAPMPTRKQERAKKRSNGKKMEQMYLDLGQRDFGHVTCNACGMVYTCAQPDDEAEHIRHHKKFVSGLKFNGWKNEKVLQEFHDGRIIMVTPDDHSSRLKKVEEIRKVVDIELGFAADLPFRKRESKTFLFIANKKVVGCCVATLVDKGYPVLPSTPSKDSSPDRQIAAWCCSPYPAPAQCGISRIWVWSQYRRMKVASRLIDCVRNCFIYGCTISKEALAFSDPTPDGKRLATAYIGTPEFLVFR